jgi:hypothetical protein
LFTAPWGRSVTITSLFSAGILLTVAALPWFLSGGDAGVPGAIATASALATLVGTAIFSIRGYAVRADAIEVRRLGWTTRLPRAGLRRVEVAPGVMRGSLRVFGNGGLFALTGRFRNARLGAYRALVTDSDRTVVLHYDNRRVVVSPDRPAEFAHALGVPLAPTGAASAGDVDRSMALRWIAIVPVVVFLGVGLLVYSETRPLEVQLDAERLHVDGGLYEVDVPLARIREVELRDSRLRIGRRTNGFAAGSARRGYFDVDGLGRTRVFTDAASGPYLFIGADDGPVILRLRNASETRQLAAVLLRHWRSPVARHATGAHVAGDLRR